jgi:hypothetical protein
MRLRKLTDLGGPGKNYFCCQTSKGSQGLLHYLPKQSIDSSHAGYQKSLLVFRRDLRQFDNADFRIFNPWLRQRKFDADCAYIKR